MMDHWKTRALMAEDRSRQLQAKIDVLEAAKTVVAKKAAKKSDKKVASGART